MSMTLLLSSHQPEMDWNDEDQVCTFLKCVRAESAQKPQKGRRGASEKWMRVRQAMTNAFPERSIQEPSTLEKVFSTLRNKVAAMGSERCSSMTESQLAMFDLLQDMQADKQSAANSLAERQEVVTSTIPVHHDKGKLCPLRQCDEQTLCTVLRILRVIKVHQYEEDIEMLPKWEIAHSMLSRTFPEMSIPVLKVFRDNAHCDYFKHIAAKFGHSGRLPADGTVLESEQLAWQMLAEDTSNRVYTKNMDALQTKQQWGARSAMNMSSDDSVSSN